MKEIYCKIYGNVQNVTYKQLILTKAKEIGVTGTIENSDEGTVEIVAQGEENNLKLFLESISVGVEGAEVESLNVQWGPMNELMQGFHIIS
ncbi:MAG: acylphosphatase [bacterium]|nr:acylphosphatase [bacterium]